MSDVHWPLAAELDFLLCVIMCRFPIVHYMYLHVLKQWQASLLFMKATETFGSMLWHNKPNGNQIWTVPCWRPWERETLAMLALAQAQLVAGNFSFASGELYNTLFQGWISIVQPLTFRENALSKTKMKSTGFISARKYSGKHLGMQLSLRLASAL